MKGLILKEFMCLRKQRIVAVLVFLAVCVLGVMYILSARFGNIYLMHQSELTNGTGSMEEINFRYVFVLVLFLIAPLAIMMDTMTGFKYDNKAKFGIVGSSLPVPIYKRVMAKYITLLIRFCIGTALVLVAAFTVSSLAKDLVTFSEVAGILLSVAAGMLMLSSAAIFACFLLGAGKEENAYIGTFFALVLVWALHNLQELKTFFHIASNFEASMNGAQADDELTFFYDCMRYVREDYWKLLLAAGLFMIVSYAGSVLLVTRKRGMI